MQLGEAALYAGRVPVAAELHAVSTIRHWLHGEEFVHVAHWADTDVPGQRRCSLPVGGGRVQLEDRWTVRGDELRLDRRVWVTEPGEGGFASTVEVGFDGTERPARLFVPGTRYGTPERTNTYAIAGPATELAGDQWFAIRADRLPAPLLGSFGAAAGSRSLAVLQPEPERAADDGTADAVGIDARARGGALQARTGSVFDAVGYVFPGLEGPVTYTGNSFPDGQQRAWRRQYHPLQAGVEQRYAVVWRRFDCGTFPEFVRESWRWAWHELSPEAERQDVAQLHEVLVDQLAGTVVQVAGRAGFPHFRDATTGDRYDPPHHQADYSLMGFTGRSTDCAYYLLRHALRQPGGDGDRHRSTAEAVLDSFARLPTSPPAGEGFDIRTGAVVPSAPYMARRDLMLLRGLAEGAKGMLRAAVLLPERTAWRQWGLDLTDWLRRQQRPDGSLPRSWVLAGDTVGDESGTATPVAVSAFALAYAVSGDRAFLTAAERAADYAWENGHASGAFSGGTVDNPDVVDKEAGTISLEGYLAVYEATGADRWLERAAAAADFAETWIYLWDVPMSDARGGAYWDPEVSTVGAQLIASGHSLVDQYMAFDVARYAKLGRYTGDDHYLDVARLLLHGTLSMVAAPGRLHGYAGPGWQQEHWSFAPPRGRGLHHGWLSWVSCAHLEGIAELQDFDPQLYAELIRSP